LPAIGQAAHKRVHGIDDFWRVVYGVKVVENENEPVWCARQVAKESAREANALSTGLKRLP
jgi:predicted transcriptional regulator